MVTVNTFVRATMILRKLLLVLFAYTAGQAAYCQGWSLLGPGHALFHNDSPVYTICTDKGGNLYAAGEFSQDSAGRYFVTRWDGQNWSKVGNLWDDLQVDNTIRTMCTDGQGNLYIAGSFGNVKSHNYVAWWNGQKWQELNNDSSNLFANDHIYSICTDQAGNLYAAGYFKNDSGYCYVARWNGKKWEELGAGNNALRANYLIWTLCTDPAGNVYAAGGFSSPAGGYYVAKWDGNKWEELGLGGNELPMGPNTRNHIHTICSDKTGNIYASGKFIGSHNRRYVAKWNGSTWTELKGLNANGYVWSVVADSVGNVYAAGNFFTGNLHYYVARWDGSQWNELGAGAGQMSTDGEIHALCTGSGGRVYAAGAFTDGNGNKAVGMYSVNTGIFPTDGASAFSLWPNPARETLHVTSHFATDQTLSVWSATGKLLISKRLASGSSYASLSVAHLSAGMYWVKAGTQVQKLVVF